MSILLVRKEKNHTISLFISYYYAILLPDPSHPPNCNSTGLLITTFFFFAAHHENVQKTIPAWFHLRFPAIGLG